MRSAEPVPARHHCSTRDGIELRGLIWSPRSPRGTVLIRTPYDAGAHAPIARSWNRRGYRCIVQDVRGRYASDGEWDPYRHEAEDGADALRAVDGEFPGVPLLLYGASYAAHTALEAARAWDGAPAGMLLLVPALGLAETARSVDGAPQYRSRIGWWHEHGRGPRSAPPLPETELSDRARRARELGPLRAAETWGWPADVLERWRKLWGAEPRNLADCASGRTEPLLLIRGDADFFHADAGRLAAVWPGRTHLVDGPWGHRLAADLDPAEAAALGTAGGLGAVIDAWLAREGLPVPRPRRPLALPDGPATRSVFGPADGAWRHERIPMHPSHLPDPIPVEDLVDAECGLIRSIARVGPPAGAPPAYLALTASVSDARRLGEWPADRVSLGTSFGDPAAARIAAIGEGIERYCGNWIPADPLPEDLRIGTAEQLRADGETVVPPTELPSFAPWQLDRADFPYRALREDTPALWARCSDRTGRAHWLPAALTHLNWRQRRFRGLPRTHHLNYAGIATGAGAEDAADRGVLEVIERDALETWWHLDGPTFGIDPATVPGLLDDLDGGELSVHLVAMPSEFAPAVAALVHDERRGLYAAGFSAHLDPVRAARKAVLEAVHTWVYTQGCTAADGWVFRAIDRGLMAAGLHLEHRANADYTAIAGPRFERVIDLGAHVQVWLDPEVHREARRFTEPALGVRSIDALVPTTMPQVYAELERRGHRVLTRDLTTSDVRRTALRVVRTVVTGLVPNAPAAFAYLGMPRFGEAALERGWRDRWTGGPDEFTLVPPPHM
ncbi:YcaO-like family protein [Leucobacter sp. PH1c]|uniref:YcaO-like family protein n=1 Tax=Leucobacter sp. PH1c TaxID=1397278 RepID=UPI0004690CAD|nr:YcaO-like family protein [Leucobacter sp. PH1c]